MDLKSINVGYVEALDKWEQYRELYKKDKSQFHKNMMDVYSQAKLGYKLIDIGEVIKAGGSRWEKDKDDSNHIYPNFAIARVNSSIVNCMYHTDGTVKYFDRRDTKQSRFYFEKLLDSYKNSNGSRGWKHLTASVPMVPKHVWNKPLQSYHYILWHVDKWSIVPSADPVLLKRITNSIFSILAHWDLTELEVKVLTEYL